MSGVLVWSAGSPREQTFDSRSDAVAHLHDYPRCGPFTLRTLGDDTWTLNLDYSGYETLTVRYVAGGAS